MCCNLTSSAPDDGRKRPKHVELRKLQQITLLHQVGISFYLTALRVCVSVCVCVCVCVGCVCVCVCVCVCGVCVCVWCVCVVCVCVCVCY